jgi:FKBP-type peptidyl-prolyl cis-trans isomerase FklB
MKKSIIVFAALLVSLSSFAQKKKDLIQEVAKLKAEASEMHAKLSKIEKAKEVNLKDSLQSFSYAFGVSVGNNLKTVGFDSLAYNAFAVALEDVMNGREKVGLAECQTEVQNTIQQIQEKEAKKQSEKGEMFLSENGKRAEVKTLESGLQYEVLATGDGTKPTLNDKVKVHYTGMLIDGKVFDSSVERGEPAVFGVTQVIKGWTEALQLMPVGSKWKVFIPQYLGYGQRGAGGGSIPPYSALVFEMELLGIE